MSLRPDVLLAIICMALATYAVRAGGYAVLRVWRPPRFVEAMLIHMPGCIFVSFILPSVAASGVWHMLAAAVAVVMMVFTRMLTLSLLAGVATLWIMLG
jgi:uncharacterized membrane protein